MDSVEILTEGYARITGNGKIWASPTTILIRSCGKRILVDPGANADLLSGALTTRNLSAKDIVSIFITHYHPDHFLNIRLFPTQDIYDGTMNYHKDEEIPYTSFLPETAIKVVATPGHAREHTSLVVDTSSGKYAVAGDVFWWQDGDGDRIDTLSLIKLADPFAQDFDHQKKSRQKLLQIADFIIPGHGRTFRVPKGERQDGI